MEFDHLLEKQMHCWKGYKKKGTKKLSSGKVVNNCVKESFDQIVKLILEVDTNRVYRVSHVGLGVSEKTTASTPEEAKRNIFGRLKQQGKLQAYQYKEFNNASVKEV